MLKNLVFIVVAALAIVATTNTKANAHAVFCAEGNGPGACL